MADISNKFLMFLLVIVILVSIVGTWYSIDRVNKLASLTGYGTAGYVNVTIGGRTEINVTQPYCGFGSGYVTEGFDFAVLHPGIGATPCDIKTTDTGDNWTNTTFYDVDCMEIINVGNTNVKVNVSSGKTAANFIGGSSPEYKVWSEGHDVHNGCQSGLIDFNKREDMDTTNKTICANLTATILATKMYAGCYLKISKDAPAEVKTDTWTFTIASA